MSDQGKPRRVLKIVCSRCGEPWNPTHLGRQCPKEQSTEQQPPRDAGGRMIDQQIWESFEESR